MIDPLRADSQLDASVLEAGRHCRKMQANSRYGPGQAVERRAPRPCPLLVTRSVVGDPGVYKVALPEDGF
jgi:hypothetical protein